MSSLFSWIADYFSEIFVPLGAVISYSVEWLVNTIGDMGYIGIVSLMFLESSFFPFPSEVVMIPAGYHVWKGEMSFIIAVFAGIVGSILGALFNYWIAIKWGRPICEKYGKYFFVSPQNLDKADLFFAKHGHISTLVGRLLPLIRQYISLPAGIAKMDIKIFSLYTAIGSGVWVTILVIVGYILGEHQEMAKKYLPYATAGAIILAMIIIVIYICKQHNKAK